MRMEFRCNEQLPMLSWLAEVAKNSDIVSITGGKGVEFGQSFFVEGAWDGDFVEGQFDKSLVFTGSGARLQNNAVLFASPCNTIEAVYMYRTDRTVCFSNSIAFLLEVTSKSLDYKYFNYENDALSISDGINEYIKTIRLADNSEIAVYYYRNIAVDDNLKVTVYEKSAPARFDNFASYYNFLREKLQSLDSNFHSDSRQHHYDPIVFSSSGYDSTACAALGKLVGCNEAVVYKSKHRDDDSGRPVVSALGYEVIYEKYETAYLEHNVAHEFLATGELGTSIYFSSAENELTGKYLLSGVQGDKVWAIDSSPNDEIIRSFFPDTARKEFRLRVGFHFVAIPFFAVRSMEDIKAISNSVEMKSWSLGNNYDRPIPRRIVEEQGVDRKIFGFRKSGGAGSSLRFLNLRYLKKVMPAGSYTEFSDFLAANSHKRPKNLEYVTRSVMYTYYSIRIFLLNKNILKFRNMFDFPRHYTCSPWAPSFLFVWAVSKVRERYSLWDDYPEDK